MAGPMVAAAAYSKGGCGSRQYRAAQYSAAVANSVAGPSNRTSRLTTTAYGITAINAAAARPTTWLYNKRPSRYVTQMVANPNTTTTARPFTSLTPVR